MIKLIPAPTKEKRISGNFSIIENTVFSIDSHFENAGKFLIEAIENSATFTPKTGEEGTVQFIFDESLSEQAYKIQCSQDTLKIIAATDNGAFYAVQSLKQLLNLPLIKDATELTMPCVEIFDEPRFAWRGLLFDEARHFAGMEEVKRVIDLMAMHKLNVLHWHLSDDQGWRIEIKKYPLLTEIGSKRSGTNINGWSSTDKDETPYEGFYTQDEIREVIAYAAQRHIMIVPEIDMPAHFAAALAAYNWLGCREIESEVQWYFGGKVPESQGVMDWNRPICAGKETTYAFVRDLLDEITDLFPARYFHVGGDEAPKDEWKKCPHCQEMMKKHSLANEEELQGYFNNVIQQYLIEKGVQLIGWNEILKAPNLDRSIIAQYWTPQRDKNVAKHIEAGGEVIMSCHQAFYFDMGYGQIQLQKTYGFEPRKFNVAPAYEKQVRGIEGALWTEWVRDREKREVSLFPRMAALAEVAWSPAERRNFKEFTGRLEHLQAMYKAMDVDYARPEISYKMGFIRRWRERIYWYKKGQYLDVFNNRKLKADEH